MNTITVDEVNAQPQRLMVEAVRGEPVMVTQDGQPVWMMVPLCSGLEALEVRLELAVHLFDRDQISASIAARIAGLCLSEMLGELSKRQIPVVRYSEAELEEELKRLPPLSPCGTGLT
jgi:predicted HTH domain antitoxin